MSEIYFINANVVQGLAVGPFCFIANATGLRPRFDGNEMGKYADDCYLIIPASNSSSILTELTNVNDWAATNNLSINIKKTQEIIISLCFVTYLDYYKSNKTRVSIL